MTQPDSMRFDVIVAGGGQVGLALALALSKRGAGELHIAVVDPGPIDATIDDAKTDARSFALGAATRRLLERIGVWPDLAHAALDVETVEITDSRLTDGVRPVLLSYETRLADGEAAMSIVPSAALGAALRVKARSARGVTLLGRARIVATERDTHAASLRLDNGRLLQAPLLVAADGRASAQRTAAEIKTVGWGHDQTGIVTTVAHELPHRACATQHFLPGGPFAILPLPGQRSCITWSEDRAAAERIMALPDEAFLAALDQRAGGRLGRLSLAGSRQSWPLSTFLARQLVANRLALIGDAVRGVHPIAGQGLNLGMRDVAALADVIVTAAGTGQDIGSLAIVTAYEQWRRADGAMSAASFDLLNRLFSNDSAVLRGVRDAGLGVVDRLPALKRQFVAEAAGLTGALPTLMQSRGGAIDAAAHDQKEARA